MASPNRFALLVLGIGIALVASPIVVFSADIGEPTYEFEATELSYENGSFEYSSQVPSSTFYIENIACVGNSRVCKLEQHVYEEGRLPVADADIDKGYYEFVHLNGSFYRTDTIEEDGTVYLTHEPVSADFALSASSISYSIAAPAYQTAVSQGHVTITERLDNRKIVSRTADDGNEQFYYVYATRTPSADVQGPSLGDRLVTYGLSVIGFVAGLALIGHGQRKRVRSQLR